MSPEPTAEATEALILFEDLQQLFCDNDESAVSLYKLPLDGLFLAGKAQAPPEIDYDVAVAQIHYAGGQFFSIWLIDHVSGHKDFVIATPTGTLSLSSSNPNLSANAIRAVRGCLGSSDFTAQQTYEYLQKIESADEEVADQPFAEGVFDYLESLN